MNGWQFVVATGGEVAALMCAIMHLEEVFAVMVMKHGSWCLPWKG